MENRDDERTETLADDAVASAAWGGETANKALRDTAQKYLNAAGIKVNLQDIEEGIRRRALFSLGIAATIGFVLGGGVATRPGALMLGLFGRTATRHAPTSV